MGHGPASQSRTHAVSSQQQRECASMRRPGIVGWGSVRAGEKHGWAFPPLASAPTTRHAPPSGARPPIPQKTNQGRVCNPLPIALQAKNKSPAHSPPSHQPTLILTSWSSKRWWGMPITTSPYLRYGTQARDGTPRHSMVPCGSAAHRPVQSSSVGVCGRMPRGATNELDASPSQPLLVFTTHKGKAGAPVCNLRWLGGRASRRRAAGRATWPLPRPSGRHRNAGQGPWPACQASLPPPPPALLRRPALLTCPGSGGRRRTQSARPPTSPPGRRRRRR